MRSNNVVLPVSETAVIFDPFERQSNAVTIKVPEGAILIIDDNFAIREVLTDILTLLLGMTVYTAVNGHEGLQIFQQRQQQINLIFLDVEMPVMNGPQTYEKLRQFAPQVKVIVSSSLSPTEARSRFGERKLPTYLQKPYDTEDLLNIVQAELANA
jgi:CheY-like chemotaxis protein